MNGFSITFVIGKYGGVYINFTSRIWRICLGWVALTIYPKNDIESYIDTLSNKIKQLKENI